jgi:pyruvate dehydrogenase E1 component alpha subunit
VTSDASLSPDFLELGRDRALALLRSMIRIRRFEEKCAELYGAGKIRGFLHLCIGEEAIPSGVMPVLDAEDNIVSTYREHGHALARGVPMGSLMAEMFGKVEGCSHGRGGSMHLFDVSRRFFGGNAIVAGGLPIALGLALSDKMRGRGADAARGRASRVTACLFGDGAVAEGEFHESMNLAALWKLPVLFLCENNQYAMGTAIARYESEQNLAHKAQSYAMEAERVDGMDVLAVEAATRRAVEHVASGSGPVFLEFVTYRFRAHSAYDPELYRKKDEVNLWRKRDPLTLFESLATERGLVGAEDVPALVQAADAEIDAAVAFAEAGTLEPIADLTKDVCAPRSDETSAAAQSSTREVAAP